MKSVIIWKYSKYERKVLKVEEDILFSNHQRYRRLYDCVVRNAGVATQPYNHRPVNDVIIIRTTNYAKKANLIIDFLNKRWHAT